MPTSSLSTRVAVVTGSNKGIGLGIVKELCPIFDGVVYLTSRKEDLGKAAVEDLEKVGLHARYHQLDIDDASSVLKFRDHLRDTYGGIDVLINNAGINLNDPDLPMTFHEKAVRTVQTNFFSTHVLCEALFPLLRPHARVVNVSSCAGHLSRLPSLDLKARFASLELTIEQLYELMNEYLEATKRGDHVERGWPNTPVTVYSPAYQATFFKLDPNADNSDLTAPLSFYEVSKIGLCALTRIQQRQFDQDPSRDIIVNSVHPGYVKTDMNRYTGVLEIDEGTVAPIWLALLPPNVEGPKGAFIWYDKQVVDWVNGPMPGIY